METIDDANSKLFPANEPEHELYTIPSSSSWFSWNEIHEKEQISLKEFFQGNSISKTPKIYKEYRDFIINKYREDPSRRLNFTEIRKSLIGDVNLIYKVFVFLDKWGLINFGAPKVLDSLTVLSQDEEKQRVVFEEGAPNGVKVVEIPNSSKVVTLPPQISVSCDRGGDVVENGFRLPPLASYSDVFGNLLRQSCVKCGEYGDFKHLQSSSNKKESIVTCSRCLKSEKNEADKAVDDLKSKESKAGFDNNAADSWTDAETLLLLEYVQLHGDDWDRVAENVRTKSKFECIAKLIQLPFGELMLSTTNGKGAGRSTDNNSIGITEDQSASLEPQKPIKEGDLLYKQINESEPEQAESGQTEGRPNKRRCMDSFADSSDSLMKQVAHLSTLVSPHVAAAAVDAAITALCQENPYARMFLESEGDDIMNVFGSHTHSNKSTSLLGVEDSEMVDSHTQSETPDGMVKKTETSDGMAEKNSTSATLRIRTAIATAFGAAAAHAKQLADQEDREIEHLVATVIETQFAKINSKIKHFEELELIMEKEYSQIQELKESIVTERIDILRQAFSAGIARWRDYSSVKSYIGNVF